MHSAHPSCGPSLHYLDTQEYLIAKQPCIEISAGEAAGFGFVLKGSAKFTLRTGEHQRTAKATYGEIFFIPPDCICSVQSSDKQPVQIIHIRFTIDGLDHNCNDAGYHPFHNYFLQRDGLRLCRFRMPRVRGWVQDLLNESSQRPPDRSLSFQVQSYFYAIAAEWMAVMERPKLSDDGLTDYVAQFKQSMLEHCGTSPDIEEIARLSGVSYTHFYQVFKRLTGLSPLQWITVIRMNESLRLLANKPSTIMEVAHSVGYSDELYFSRQFKKHIGLSPTKYAACAKTRVANLCPVFRGDLSVLGLTPVLELRREWYDDPDKEKYYQQIERCQPDVIITAPVADEVYDTLSHIAPVMMIRWKGYPWKERLLQISRTLNIPTVAEWWLSYFQSKVEHARGHLQEHLGEEPFLVVSALEPFYRVYGLQRTKMKDLFYDELQLRPPECAHEIAFLDVKTLAEVATLDCGNIIVLAPVSLSDEDCIRLEEEWLELKRNRRQKRCIFIRHEEPLLYNASFYEGLLDQFVDQLIG